MMAIFIPLCDIPEPFALRIVQRYFAHLQLDLCCKLPIARLAVVNCPNISRIRAQHVGL